MPTSACKKKLYAFDPKIPPLHVTTQHTSKKERVVLGDSQALERNVRQLLADKVSGNQVGIWLLVPEHLRLGTWDLLRRWSGEPTEHLYPRLAMQVVNESVLCTCNLRCGRTLSQKGFELANGLPFVAADQAVHQLFSGHTVAEAQALQTALGKLRLASGHFRGRLLAVDPHRCHSYSKRQMRRHQLNAQSKPGKVTQTFFLLDTETFAPVCFTIGSAARTATQAAPELLDLAEAILCLQRPGAARPLVMADEEHYTSELFQKIGARPFDLLVPMKSSPHLLERWRRIPPEQFQRHWAGFATVKNPYQFGADKIDCFEIVERFGEVPADYQFKGFLSSADRPEVQDLSCHFPQRWHVEEFFKFDQALGWKRAGTLNLNIRYGQMTMALVAQAVLHQFRQRIGSPYQSWDAVHMAKNLFSGLDGDIRVHDDTIVITYYNAPNVDVLRARYEELPQKLQAENIDPRIPWLFNFKLDFRFK